MEEDFAGGDFADGILQSPRSPVQSSYGGSDAGDEIHEIENNDEQPENDVAREDSLHDQTEEEPEEEPEEEKNETGDSKTVETNDGTATSEATDQPVAEVVTAPAPEGKRYKYKYPEAYPTPPGWDDEVWNKAYTAADSRIYNHAKKNHMVSKQKRAEGVTREEALDWEKNKPQREAKKASKKNGAAPKQQISRAEGISSKSTSNISTSLDSDMAKKAQKKKAKPTATPVGNGSYEQGSSFADTVSEDLSQFAFSSHQTLADRVKGKSAASAAASSAVSNDTSTSMMGGSEKAQQPKQASVGSVPAKKTGWSKGDVHPPLVRAPVAPKFTAPKARTSSKSGTPASALNNSLQDYSELEEFTDAEGEDDGTNTLFCVCRGLLSTNMIACDNCSEWFHRRAACLGKDDPAIYKVHEPNIDKWFCPTCRDKKPSLQITFYRMCRREGCAKPALVDDDPPNKYCSEACAVEFFREHLAKAPKDANPSKGGALTQSEIGNLLGSASSASEFKNLGKAAPKLRGKGKIVSRQYLRNLVVGNNSAKGGGEKDGKVYENKADYEEKTTNGEKVAGEDFKEENTDEDWERSAAARREIYNQEPYYLDGRRSSEEFALATEKALGGAEEITTENYLDVDWSFLQRHGMCNPSEAEAIHELQEMIQYDQLWINVSSLRVSFIKAVRQQSAKILRAENKDPKTTCGYLPTISQSEFLFKIYSETPEGAHIVKTGRYEHVDPDYDEEFQKESEASICLHSAKKHPTHYAWAETHEKENIGRRVQLTQDMRTQLVSLNEIMGVIHQRMLEPGWVPILG